MIRGPRRLTAVVCAGLILASTPAVAHAAPTPTPAPTKSVRSIGDTAQVAAAFQALFLAAGGGGLGLFTAIRRLRDVHARIAGPLEEAGIPLYAQHIDAMDNATLVDVFRAADALPAVVEDALALSPPPKAIWGQLSVRHDEAAATAEAAGVKVVMDRCPAIEYPRLVA